MAARAVVVPNIGDFKDVPVVEVLVKPGDTVGVEDPIVALESEKATMEIPSPFAGTVASLSVNVGDAVSAGTPLLTLETEDAAPGAAKPNAAAAPPDAPPPAAPRVPEATEAAADVAPVVPDAQPATPSSYGASGTAAPEQASHDATSGNGVVHASPSIRRFARELGVDLHGVHGTGPHARVTRDDVQHFVRDALAAPPARGAGAPAGLAFDLPSVPKIDFAKYGEIERVPLSRIRKISGPNLHRNWLAIPHVTNHEEADVTELEAFRHTLRAEGGDVHVTMLAFVIRAVVAALQAHPELNSSLDGDALVFKKYYNIGFAADTPGGLVVPVVANADRKGIRAIAAETAALAARARAGKLAAAEMSGASFTISSLGGIGGTAFTPIVNAPEVAILGVSRATVRPVWNGTAFVPRTMLPLSLSYDHRVVDGALAARFNATLAAALADLRRILL